MKTLINYSKFIPYLYFIAVTTLLFTDINGIKAYPVLLLSIPFFWQIIKPNKTLNFSLGITFLCLSSYLILIYLSDIFSMITISQSFKSLLIFSGFFVFTHFIMASWILRNSIRRSF
ncbi:hypothetical protein [Yeosuana marina]|uniref:hypothetical protein n=1 Tax=Yeosuana marina TaxID=1565536 RepID=UPI0030C829BD